MKMKKLGEVSESPIVVSKPCIRYAPTQHANSAEEGMSSQEEAKLFKLIEEYNEVLSNVPTQTTVYEHAIMVSDPTKFDRRTYPIPVSYTHLDVYKRQSQMNSRRGDNDF